MDYRFYSNFAKKKKMADKFKKIETRLHPEDYSRLKDISDSTEESIYELAQNFINRGISEYGTSDKNIAVTAFVNDEEYKILEEIAKKNEVGGASVISQCIGFALKSRIIPNEKAKKVMNNKNRQV